MGNSENTFDLDMAICKAPHPKALYGSRDLRPSLSTPWSTGHISVSL